MVICQIKYLAIACMVNQISSSYNALFTHIIYNMHTPYNSPKSLNAINDAVSTIAVKAKFKEK